MHRHVQVLDEVYEEPQGKPPILDRLGWVLERGSHLRDLVDNAPFGGRVARESGIVLRFIERNVNVVPWCRLRKLSTVLVRPGCCMGKRRTGRKDGGDRGLGFGVEMLLGKALLKNNLTLLARRRSRTAIYLVPRRFCCSKGSSYF